MKVSYLLRSVLWCWCYDIRNKINALIPILSLSLFIKFPLVMGFMTSAPDEIAAPDIFNKCPSTGPSSCYAIGVQAGEVAGNETRQTGLGYSLVGGVGEQHSPNFSLGYLIGYSRAFNIPMNASYIVSIANKTGTEDGGNANSSSPSQQCTVSELWCNNYDLAFKQGYLSSQPYWVGNTAGQKYAQRVIDACTQKNHPDFKFLKHHTSKYRQGFEDGYDDTVAAASNDNGTYGPKQCKE
jgi:hypothetical protein